jgi:hypothetical protein
MAAIGQTVWNILIEGLRLVRRYGKFSLKVQRKSQQRRRREDDPALRKFGSDDQSAESVSEQGSNI